MKLNTAPSENWRMVKCDICKKKIPSDKYVFLKNLPKNAIQLVLRRSCPGEGTRASVKLVLVELCSWECFNKWKAQPNDLSAEEIESYCAHSFASMKFECKDTEC